jgi:hypothetical protein
VRQTNERSHMTISPHLRLPAENPTSFCDAPCCVVRRIAEHAVLVMTEAELREALKRPEVFYCPPK